MKTNLPIPIYVVNKISTYLLTTYPNISETHKSKLFSKLIELWFFVYDSHNEEKAKKLNKFFNNHIDNIYVNISRTELKIFNVYVGKQLQYIDLLKILESTGLIDINSSYEVGKNSKSYRANPAIQYNLIETIEIDVTKFIKSNASKSEILAKNPGYETLIENLYLIKIDLPNFFNKLDESINQVYKWDKGEPKILTNELAYALKIKAIKINLGIHFFTVSSTGRVYSSLANLPKVCLPFILLNGFQPIEIDATNCQPLLLSSIINNIQFKTDCELGIFYNEMANHLGISRDEFKILSYAEIFFNNKKITQKMAIKLNTIYPGLSEEINEYKYSSKKAAKAQPETDLLWFRLQSLESSIFIKTALEQITPVITRHDSILCLPSQCEEICKSITNKFLEIGISVNLKIN